MPRKYVRKTKKRPAKKYHKKRTSTGYVISRNPKPIPDRLFLKMAYSDNIQILSGAAPGSAIYRSSIFDPQLAIGGHQPFGRDQWAAFYNSYIVYGIGYEIEFINSSVSQQMEVAVVLKNSTLITTSMNTIYEKPYGKTQIVGIEGSGKNIRKIKGYMSVSKQHGIPKQKVKLDNEFSSLMTTNPAKEAYIHIYTQAIDGLAAVTMHVRLSLTYYTQLFDRVPLTGS